MDSETVSPPQGRQREVARQYQSVRVFEARDTAESLKADLAEIARLDKQHSEQAQRNREISVYIAIALVGTLSALVFFGLSKLGMLIPAALVTLFVVLLPFLFWYNRKSRLHGRLDGENRRYELPSQLIDYLSADMAPNSQIHLKIDFRHYLAGPFQKGKTEGGVWRTKEKSRHLVPWLSLKGRFLDGTRFQFEISQIVQRKVKRKRRTTCVETFSDRYDLALMVKPERYKNLELFPSIFPTIKPPAGVKMSEPRVSGETIECSGVGPAKTRSTSEKDNSDPYREFPVDPALQMFLAAYQGIGKCAAGTY